MGRIGRLGIAAHLDKLIESDCVGGSGRGAPASRVEEVIGRTLFKTLLENGYITFIPVDTKSATADDHDGADRIPSGGKSRRIRELVKRLDSVIHRVEAIRPQMKMRRSPSKSRTLEMGDADLIAAINKSITSVLSRP